MNTIKLSYIISTRNRLNFLKIILPILVENVKNDEEIVIVDANSTDGSKEYIEILFTKGLIHQFISEPDINQAHGWNKAILMAKGDLIKKIIDDDIYSFSAINTCRQFMLEHNDIDLCISNESSVCFGSGFSTADFHSTEEKFKNWKEKNISSFPFSDVHMIIRRSSLPLIGIYDTNFIILDWEYSLRATFLNAKIALYSGYNALGVLHNTTITSGVSHKTLVAENKKLKVLYNYNYKVSLWSRIKISIGKIIYYKKIIQLPNPINDYSDLNSFYIGYFNSLSYHHEEHKLNYKFLF